MRMALMPDPTSNSDESRGPVGAGRGNLPFSLHEVQPGIGAVSVVNAPPKLSHATAAATFHALQEWEGHVLEIGGDEFVAALIDLTAGSSHEEEEAIIPLTEISDGDAATLRVGAIFRWVIGYERSPSGTKKTCFPDCISRSSPDYRSRSAARQGVGTRDQAGIRAVTDGGNPPRDDEFELTLLGPGYGESIVMHVGDGAWVLVDSCGRTDAPVRVGVSGDSWRRSWRSCEAHRGFALA